MVHPAISRPASRRTATGDGGCRRGVSMLHDWLRRAGPRRRAGRPARPAAPRAAAPGQARRRLRRRVLARQVRAHQRDLLRRLRPATAAVVGRAHDDVPDRAPVRRVAPAVDPPAADRDAPQGRDRRRVQELRRRVGDVPARPVVRRADERSAVARVAGQARAVRARAQVRAVRATARTTSSRRSSTATRAASTSRAGATRSSTSRIRCCSRAS